MFHFGIIPGDVAGKIRTRCALKVLARVASLHGIDYQLDTFDLGADNYIETGELISKDQLVSLGAMDGIFLGGFGDPRLERSVCDQGIKARIWAELNLVVTMRHVFVYSDTFCPLKSFGQRAVDFVIVRENTETSYSNLGSFIHKNTPDELALTQGVFIRKTVERVMRSAFILAHRRQLRKLTLIDRSRRVPAHDLGRRVFADISREYPDVVTNAMNAEEAAGAFLVQPEQFDVIVTTADIGDMLMGMGLELQGGPGFGFTAYHNPGQISMFEPCPSAEDDWEAQRSPNPVGAIAAMAHLLVTLGKQEAAVHLGQALSRTVREHGELFSKSSIDSDAVAELVIEYL
ncbi:hypothetical protein IJT17_10405 [bacterium]|nr:hypothetical protein [bacterium]